MHKKDIAAKAMLNKAVNTNPPMETNIWKDDKELIKDCTALLSPL